MPSFKSLASSALLAATAIAAPNSKLQKRAPAYGVVINSCTVPGVVAVSFDDGPSIYTESVLDKFKAAGQKATFFVNGMNYGNIYDYNSTILRMKAEGHQVGSHTWSHADLATLTADGVRSQMTQLEDAMVAITGSYGTYMRPPYLSTNAQALSVLAQLQYVVAQIDIDTKDYENTSPTLIVNAENNYLNGLNAGGSISLSHDPLVDTANSLVPYILNLLAQRGLKSVPVGQCLGDPASNWYRPARNGGAVSSASASLTSSVSRASGTAAAPSSAAPSGVIDPNGTCGGANKYVCAAGSCCSQYGYCGTTSEFCTNCQAAFGTCPGSTPASSAVATSSARASAGVSPVSSARSASAAAPSSAAPSGVIDPNGSCGGANKYVCAAGSCCSQYGYCGTTSEFCTNCQAAFGTCPGSAPASSAAAPVSSARASSAAAPVSSARASSAAAPVSSARASSAAAPVSSARASSAAAPVLSARASSAAAPVSSARAASSVRASSAAAASPSVALTVDSNGTCGKGTKFTCSSTQCCSQYGYCGTTSQYCGTGCQAGFGKKCT